MHAKVFKDGVKFRPPRLSPCNAKSARTRKPTAVCAFSLADDTAHQIAPPVAATTVIGFEITATTETSAGPLTKGMNADACAARM